MRGLRTSVIPATVALAAFFLVLQVTGGDTVVRMTGELGSFSFDQQAIRIEPGQRIAFQNDTQVTHTAECVSCPWASGDVQPADLRLVAFDEVGAFEFRCRYHPEMSGVIGVGTEPVAPDPTPDPAPQPVPPTGLTPGG